MPLVQFYNFILCVTMSLYNLDPIL